MDSREIQTSSGTTRITLSDDSSHLAVEHFDPIGKPISFSSYSKDDAREVKMALGRFIKRMM